MRELDSLIDRNFKAFPNVFIQWMNLPESIALPQIEIEPGDPEILEDLLDDLSKRFEDLLSESKFRQAILLPDQVIRDTAKLVSGNDLKLLRAFLLRSRGLAQASFVEESGLFIPFDQPNAKRSKVLISAGVDHLKADLEIGYTNFQLNSADDYFEAAGMPRLAFTIRNRSVPAEMVRPVYPVPPTIQILENELTRGLNIDYSKLVLQPSFAA